MPDPKPRKPSSSLSPSALSPSDFSHTLTKTSVAQILRFTGFKSSKSSALATLIRIATLFLQSLSNSAASHAAYCRRTHCNAFDVVHAIENHSLSFGFDGASDINQPLVNSKAIKDLRYVVDAMAEIRVPFFRRVPYRVRNSASSSSVVFYGQKFEFEKDCRGLEIPRWLPEFPEIGNVDGVISKDREVLWEERRLEYCSPKAAKKIEKGKKEFLVQGRRERVKFRLGGGRRNIKLGGLGDDLELRNGVCRGGKRVCLNNRRVDTSRFFKDDDDKDFTSGL